MTEINKEQIVEQLRTDTLVVTFNKLNGEKRVMTCTLNESMLPVVPATPADDEQAKRTRKPNDDVQSVWDVNAKGWRSFRWDKVISVDAQQQ